MVTVSEVADLLSARALNCITEREVRQVVATSANATRPVPRRHSLIRLKDFCHRRVGRCQQILIRLSAPANPCGVLVNNC